MIFLSFFDRYLNSRIMAVAMDPKPNKLEANVMLKFRNLKVRTRLNWYQLRYIVFIYSKEIIHIFRLMKEKRHVYFGGALAKGNKLKYITTLF